MREAYAPFPDQNVADKVLIRRASEGVGRAAAALRGTIFGKGMLSDPVNCNLILAAVHSQPAATIKVWIQAVTETYPTMVRLHLCTPAKHPSSTCPWCSSNVPETLAHFFSVCTAFHHARTAAHNQVWQAITSALKRTLQPEWRLFIETSIRDTGLLRGPVDRQPSVRGSQSVPDLARFGNLRPDAVAVTR